jgi:manganese/zinc/iron transport system substrate-binding protein
MIHFFAAATILLLSVFSTNAQSQQPLTVVATTNIIADTARTIAGDDAHVVSLMGPGVDPHLYKASPGDLRSLSSASIVFHNGLHLEGKLGEALTNLASRKPVVAVSDGIPKEKLKRLSESGELYDPHVWFDPQLWVLCAAEMSKALSKYDPARAERYERRFQELRESLIGLDIWGRDELNKIPSERRILVTAHDAFGYFGKAYNLELLAIQGISTESEASLRTINDLVEVIARRKIPAIFIENTISPKTVESLVDGVKAKGHEVKIGGELYGDSLGAQGTPGESYSGALGHNITTITRALLEEKKE